MKKTNEKMFKGYKGFSPGMICRGKQYAENTVFHENEAKTCEKRMYFCDYPLNVLFFYPPVENGKISEYAEVEAPCKSLCTDYGTTYCSKKLHIKNKLRVMDLCQEAINWVRDHVNPTSEEDKDASQGKVSERDYSYISSIDVLGGVLNNGMWSIAKNTNVQAVAAATGAYSVAANYGDQSISAASSGFSVAYNMSYESVAAATGDNSIANTIRDRSVAVVTGCGSVAINEGYDSVAINTGENSLVIAGGEFSVAITTGYDSAAIAHSRHGIAIALSKRSIVKGALGSWIVCAEWESPDGVCCNIANLKAAFVDGEKIKADTYYMLKNGKFVEVKDA